MHQLDMFADEPSLAGPPGTEAARAATAQVAAAAPDAPPFDSVEAARSVARGCVRCDLSQSRRQVVFGVGRVPTRLAIFGEGPSEADDRSGLPFSGPTGNLLDKWLELIGLPRAEVW